MAQWHSNPNEPKTIRERFIAALDLYNEACEAQNIDLIEEAADRLVNLGAWVDSQDLWRSPDDTNSVFDPAFYTPTSTDDTHQVHFYWEQD